MSTRHPTIASGSSTRPQTGEEYLASLRDDREVYIYGKRIEDVTSHPAYRNSAATISGLYDSLHDGATNGEIVVPTDTGSGGFTHAFFKVPHTKEDLVEGREAIRAWQRQTCGWMGRTPDYKASMIATLGADPEFFGEFADNARYWYTRVQEEVLHVGHAIVHPPVDRAKGVEQVKDVFVHVDEEVDGGLIVSGAKVVATGAALTQYCFVSHFGAALGKKEFALIFMAPMNGSGVKLYSRHSYEFAASAAASPFDYPLSSRFDENDAILVFDRAFIPWENVLIYDTKKIEEFNVGSYSWGPRAAFQASTRLEVKLDFIIGLVSKALDVTGAGGFRGVQAQFGEIIAFRNIAAALRDAMIQEAAPGFGGSMVPNTQYALAYAAAAPGLYSRMRQIIETIIASGLIYLNSNAVDFQVPEIKRDLDRFMRGSNGLTAMDRSKVMKALWDSIGSEFGARHELYELNYWGQPEKTYLDILSLAEQDGYLAGSRKRAEVFMDSYDLSGFKTGRLTNPTDVSRIGSDPVNSLAPAGDPR
ncbi:4-hydroxyphenylacetate 3-hydroxylase N-terminal domain-containing protein [Millisia brevis]|uniref:4-hydroxyphenylacetate 3-hydroxylase N-terminal domain-containing protein n=1 Tax=Millisia brevis TaxID=264148 RepID=UPI00083779EF|nr:4-hydroxyphenylacetate 3-hydroxylase N-terminal domain-containing protein [Millisia brevis]